MIRTGLTIRAVVRLGAGTGAAALLAGCGRAAPIPTVGDVPEAQSIEGIRWEPAPSGGDRVEGAFLTFDDALHWHASDGCSEILGSYEFLARSGGRVAARQNYGDLRHLPSGARCRGVPTGSALAAAAFLRLDRGQLLLISAHDQVLLRLEPADGS